MTHPLLRTTLILLAAALNGWPLRDSGGRAPGFALPAPAASISTTPSFREEVINPDSPHQMSHVASIAELPGGRLVAAWYAGSREGGRDVAIYAAARGPSDTSWSQPRAIVTRESASRDLNRYVKKVGNAVIFGDSGGTLWLLYVTVSVGGWSGSSLNAATSADGGTTWTRSVRLTLSPFVNLSEQVKNPPVALTTGGWAVPIHHEFAVTFPEMLWLDDRRGAVRVSKSRVGAGWFGYQPALALLSTTRALVLLRSDDESRSVSVAQTEDAGKSWSTPKPIDLPNPDAGLGAVHLGDSRIVLAFNDSTTGRDNLRLAMSVDEGRTWTRVATLAEAPGADFSYPFLMRARNGDIHLVYTWRRMAIRHVVFNPAWLDERWSEATR